MENPNRIHNLKLYDMLRQAEKKHCQCLQKKMQQRIDELKSGNAPRVMSESSQSEIPVRRAQQTTRDTTKLSEPATPDGKAQQMDRETPLKMERPKDDLHAVQTDIVPLTLDEFEWLEEVARKYGLADISSPVRCLVDRANGEPREAKKKLFLVIRCRRCSAGAKGGVKHDFAMELSCAQWLWLKNVKERSQHASIGKTIRIVIDFYMELCKGDPDFERTVLQAGSGCK